MLDTEGVFRLIESISSPNTEPFKMWLAILGKSVVADTNNISYKYIEGKKEIE